MDKTTYDRGLQIRKSVLGNEFVDKAIASADDFNRPMQDLTTEYCWGYVWGRDGLTHKTRSFLNLAMLCALNRPQELKTRYKEPWMTQNAISTYGDMWVIKDALEKAGKADRVAVADALRTMDAGPSKYYPLGEIKFDEKGRRVGAGMTIVQWQTGVPVTVFPPQLALAQPFWPKN